MATICVDRHPERNFEVVAGKVFNLDGSQHRFAFARNGNSVSEFTNALVSAGVRLGTPATVLSDGDAGLWKLQRQVMPEAMVVLDCDTSPHALSNTLQATPGLGAGVTSGHFGDHPVRALQRAKRNLWHGRPNSCLGRLAKLANGLALFTSATCAARLPPDDTSMI